MLQNKLTYVLPCAGAGTRLGLPYPKELHGILPNASLIDFSLAHINSSPDFVEKVVVVISPGKEAIPEYVLTRLPENISVEVVYFNDAYSEWPGSILSAEKHFGAYNAVLLPDSHLTVRPGCDLSREFVKYFERGAELCFGYLPQDDPEKLRALGALQVDEDKVSAFCDKPAPNDPRAFNGFWTSFGFSELCAARVLHFMMASVARQTVAIDDLQINARAFAVENYIDLGTWPAIANFLGSKRIAER